MLWDDLTQSQVGAAQLIGWDAELWTNELEAAGGATEEADEDKASGEAAQIVEGVFDKEWTELTKAEAKAAKKLGYTKKTWYDSAPPKLVPYGELSSAEKKAGAVLGWEEELWNNELKAAQEEAGGGGGAAEEVDLEEEEDDELVEVEGAFDKEWTASAHAICRCASDLEIVSDRRATPSWIVYTIYDRSYYFFLTDGLRSQELSKSEAKAARRLGYTASSWYLLRGTHTPSKSITSPCLWTHA